MRLRSGSKGSVVRGREADEVIGAGEDADLFAHHAAVAMHRHRQHHEELIAEDVQLRALARVQHVFERELVQVEQAPEAAQGVGVGAAVDLDPGARPTRSRYGVHSSARSQRALDVVVAIVIHEPDLDRATLADRRACPAPCPADGSSCPDNS
jgi:hypothetical protein